MGERRARYRVLARELGTRLAAVRREYYDDVTALEQALLEQIGGAIDSARRAALALADATVCRCGHEASVHGPGLPGDLLAERASVRSPTGSRACHLGDCMCNAFEAAT